MWSTVKVMAKKGWQGKKGGVPLCNQNVSFALELLVQYTRVVGSRGDTAIANVLVLAAAARRLSTSTAA